MNWVNHNGIISSGEEAIVRATNRSLKYGDALFETMRMFDGQIPFLDYHYQRLSRGMKTLGMKPIRPFPKDAIIKQIDKLSLKYPYKNLRIRLTIYRAGEGLYTPDSEGIGFILEANPLPSNKFKWSMVKTWDVFPEPILFPSIISPLKTVSALPYVLAANYKKEQGVEEVFLLNSNDRIAEALSSNIFVVKNNTILTPALSEGCVAGTMRQVVLETLDEMGFPYKQSHLLDRDLASANELFLCNAIQGIRSVQQFGSRIYSSKVAEFLVNALNDRIHEKTNQETAPSSEDMSEL